MAYLPNQGTNPQGELKSIPIGGIAWRTSTPLAANASTNTGWMPNQGAVLYVIRSDQVSASGGIVVEFSDDGTNPIMAGASITYNQTGQQIQRALVPKGSFTRITYTNGSTAQTTFRFEVRLSPTLIQPTEGSMNLPLTDTALGMYVVSDLQATDGTTYDRIQRQGNALRVYVDNQSSPASSVTVSNFPSSQVVTGPLTDAQLRATPVTTTLQGSSTATVTTQTTLATVTTVLAANANRKGAKFFSVTGTILLKYGTGASTTNFTERLVTNGTHELAGPEVYKGVVTAIGAGTLNVTEW